MTLRNPFHDCNPRFSRCSHSLRSQRTVALEGREQQHVAHTPHRSSKNLTVLPTVVFGHSCGVRALRFPQAFARTALVVCRCAFAVEHGCIQRCMHIVNTPTNVIGKCLSKPLPKCGSVQQSVSSKCGQSSQAMIYAMQMQNSVSAVDAYCQIASVT